MPRKLIAPSQFCALLSLLAKNKANREGFAAWCSELGFFICVLAQKENQSIWVKRFGDLSWVAILAWLRTLQKISLRRRCASVKLWSTWAQSAAGREIILTEEHVNSPAHAFWWWQWKESSVLIISSPYSLSSPTVPQHLHLLFAAEILDNTSRDKSGSEDGSGGIASCPQSISKWLSCTEVWRHLLEFDTPVMECVERAHRNIFQKIKCLEKHSWCFSPILWCLREIRFAGNSFARLCSHIVTSMCRER